MDEPALAPSYRCYAVERIVFSLIVLWLGLTFIFAMFWVVPEDPGVLFAGKGADAGTVEASRQYLHLDQSLVDQYGMFLGRVVRADLGYSWYNRESVGRTNNWEQLSPIPAEFIEAMLEAWDWLEHRGPLSA